MTVTNQNYTYEQIKGILNLRDICYHSVQNISYSHLLSKRLKCTTIFCHLFYIGVKLELEAGIA
jgi:hypothetical protein